MTLIWFYEYEGIKVGPVPPATIRHLAACGAITQETKVWQGDMETPVLASRIKNLFPSPAVSAPPVNAQSIETVRAYLTEALNACRDEDEDRLKKHVPPLFAIHPFSTPHILLDFDIVQINKLPTPIIDPSLPMGQRTKPVRQLFEAAVRVVLCDRPSYRGSLEEIRRLQVGRCEQAVTYECKEFMDGEWLFLNAALTK